jgi:hypothetical protein
MLYKGVLELGNSIIYKMVKRGARTPIFQGTVVKRRRRGGRRQTGSGGNFPVFHGQKYQYGGRVPIMQMQRGRGLGGMFRGLLRTVAPHLKRGLAHVGKRAVMAGVNAMNDMSENNTSLKDALKKQVRNEVKALNPINMMRAKKRAPSSRRKRKLNSPPGLI